MKVAFVHSYYSSRQASGENIVVDAQVEALREAGIDVEIFSVSTDELELERGYRFKTALGVATGINRSPLIELSAFAPDIVHVHNLFPNWGSNWLFKWKGPLVVTVHNYRPICVKGTLFRNGSQCTLCPDGNRIASIKNACYRESILATIPLAIRNRRGVNNDELLTRADKIFLLSERARDTYVNYGLADERIELIPNFIADSGFKPEEPPGNGWIFVGRLSEEKGIINLIKHWPIDYQLDIYGSGPLEDEVRELISGRTHISFNGAVDRTEIPAILSAGKGLVFPSECIEGAPMVYVETLASGRPVVALIGNSVADDILKSGSGLVFNKWSDLSRTIQKAENSKENLGVIARQNFLDNYSKNAWLRSTLSSYSAVIEAAKNLSV